MSNQYPVVDSRERRKVIGTVTLSVELVELFTTGHMEFRPTYRRDAEGNFHLRAVTLSPIHDYEFPDIPTNLDP